MGTYRYLLHSLIKYVKRTWHCGYSIELTWSIYLFLCQRGHPRAQHFRPAALTDDRLAILPIVRNQIGSIRGLFGLVINLHLKFCQKNTRVILYNDFASIGSQYGEKRRVIAALVHNSVKCNIHFTVFAFFKQQIDLKYLSTAKKGRSWNDDLHYPKTVISLIHAKNFPNGKLHLTTLHICNKMCRNV